MTLSPTLIFPYHYMIVPVVSTKWIREFSGQDTPGAEGLLHASTIIPGTSNRRVWRAVSDSTNWPFF